MKYEEFVSMIKKSKYIETRFDAVCYCMGYFGELTEENFNMIQKMCYEDKLLDY